MHSRPMCVSAQCFVQGCHFVSERDLPTSPGVLLRRDAFFLHTDGGGPTLPNSVRREQRCLDHWMHMDRLVYETTPDRTPSRHGARMTHPIQGCSRTSLAISFTHRSRSVRDRPSFSLSTGSAKRNFPCAGAWGVRVFADPRIRDRTGCSLLHC